MASRNTATLTSICSGVVGGCALAAFSAYQDGRLFTAVGFGMVAFFIAGVAVNLIGMLPRDAAADTPPPVPAVWPPSVSYTASVKPQESAQHQSPMRD